MSLMTSPSREMGRALRLGESFSYAYELRYEYNDQTPTEETFQPEHFPNEGGELTCGVQ
jgi:hypothetical protein